MKKRILLVGFYTLFLLACYTSKEKKIAFEKLEYSAITRGYSEQVFIDKDSVYSFQNNQKTLSISVTDKIITSLEDLLKDIDISHLNQIIIPSENFQSDRMMYTTLEIVWKGEAYKTKGFDNDNPPKELSPLLVYLEQLTQ